MAYPNGAWAHGIAMRPYDSCLRTLFISLVKALIASHIDVWAPAAFVGPALTLATVVQTVARTAGKILASDLGATPRQVDRELRMFSRAARLLSSDHPRLIDEHPKEWVGIYDGKIQATAKSFRALVSQLKKRGLRPSEAIIRYIDTSGRKLILYAGGATRKHIGRAIY